MFKPSRVGSLRGKPTSFTVSGSTLSSCSNIQKSVASRSPSSGQTSIPLSGHRSSLTLQDGGVHVYAASSSTAVSAAACGGLIMSPTPTRMSWANFSNRVSSSSNNGGVVVKNNSGYSSNSKSVDAGRPQDQENDDGVTGGSVEIDDDDVLVVEELIEADEHGAAAGTVAADGRREGEYIYSSSVGVSYQGADMWEGGDGAGGECGGHTTQQQQSSSSSTEISVEIDAIDAYARARVLNYVRRHNTTATATDSGASPFVTKEIGGAAALYMATLVLPMPDPRYGRRVACGVAGSVKDAEHIAAMHAERVINALGLQLYGLPSSQERYATQLKKSSGGHLWAPMPHDPPKPFETPSPPYLEQKNAREKAAANAAGSQKGGISSPTAAGARKIGGTVKAVSALQEFTLTCRSSALSASLDHTIASPNFIDPHAVRRVKRYIAEHNINFGKVSRMIKLKEPPISEFNDPQRKMLLKANKTQKPSSSSASHTTTSTSPTRDDAQKAHMRAKQEERDEEYEFEEWDNDPSQLQFPDERGEVVKIASDTKQTQRRGSANYSQVRDGTATSDLMYQVRGEWYLCQITVPGTPPEVGEVVAMGRAADTKTALQLACMHAELLIDALGLALFPSDPVAQLEHSREAQRVGRWATPNCHKPNPSAASSFSSANTAHSFILAPTQVNAFRSIKPLQFTFNDLSRVSGAATTTASLTRQREQNEKRLVAESDGSSSEPLFGRVSVVEYDDGVGEATNDVILMHARLLNQLTLTHINVDFQDHAARSRLRDYLARVERGEGSMRSDSSNASSTAAGSLLCPTTGAVKFFTEKLGNLNPTFRASISIPLPNSAQYGRRVACGVGPTEDAAEILCAMHALQILGELQVSVYDDTRAQQEYYTTMTACGGAAAHYLEATREAIAAELSAKYPAIAPHNDDNNNNTDNRLSSPSSSSAATTSSVVHEIGNLSAVPTPCMFKLVSREKKGRIFFGISKEEEGAEWGSDNSYQRLRLSEEAYDKMLKNGQRSNAPELWSLAPDASVLSDLYHASDVREAASALHVASHMPLQSLFGPDGRARIVVSPSAKLDEQRMYIHTLSGARHFDSRSIDRLSDYLERNGRPLGSYSTSVFQEPVGGEHGAEKSSGNSAEAVRLMYRVVCPLPVPSHFGLRIAVGEAPTAEAALRCAAIHAELTLDAIGVRLYDHDVYQRKHAETARHQGRWAPLPETVVPYEAAETFASPPAVRLETEDSAVWKRVLQNRNRGEAHHAVFGEDGKKKNAVTSAAMGAYASHANNPEQALVDEALAADGFEFLNDVDLDATEGDALLGGLLDGGEGAAAANDASAMDLSLYDPILSNKLKLSVRNRVEFFFRGHGGDLTRMERWSAKPKGFRSNVFFASVVMPFPPEYGVRVARGAAMTRRESVLTCLAHAERMIDALGFQVSGRQHIQWQHHHRAKEEGRWAPTPFTQPKAPITPTTFGLKCVTEVVEHAVPKMPVYAFESGRVVLDAQSSSPSFDAGSVVNSLDPFEAWFVYTRQCHLYAMHAEENKILMAAERGKTPRSGDAFEDEALDEVEKFKISRLAIGSLKDFARQHGYSAPENISAESIGNGVDKKYYAQANVIGTPYTARGLCEQRHDAICLAAMHYQQILNKIIVTNTMVKAGLINGSSSVMAGGEGFTERGSASADSNLFSSDEDDGLLFNPVTQNFTTRGKRIAVRFFAELVAPHKPVKETVKRPLTADENHHHIVATLELEDKVGLKQMIKHEAKRPILRRGDQHQHAAEERGPDENTTAPLETLEESVVVLRQMKREVLAKCYNDLFSSLSSKGQVFTTFLQLLKQHPKLQLGLAIKASVKGKDLSDLNNKVRAVMLQAMQNAVSISNGSNNGGAGGTPIASLPTARPLGPGSDLNDPYYLEKLERMARLARLGVAIRNGNSIRKRLEALAQQQREQAAGADLTGLKQESTLSSFMSNEVMREEHAQLLASYLSHRPLGDTSAFYQSIKSAVEEVMPGGAKGAADVSDSSSVSALIDAIDEAFVDVSSRTIVDLHRNNFVVSFDITYEEAQQLLLFGDGNLVRTNNNNNNGIAAVSSPLVGSLSHARAPPLAPSSPHALGTQESMVRHEELTVALPTLFGAMTTLVASRLCTHLRGGGGNVISAANVASRTEVDKALALAKMLVASALMPNKAAYDCAVTAVAAASSDATFSSSSVRGGEGNENSIESFLNMNIDDGVTTVSGGGERELPPLAERCLKLTAEAVSASASSTQATVACNNNSNNNSNGDKRSPSLSFRTALVSRRKDVHTLVVQSLKDLAQQLTNTAKSAGGGGAEGGPAAHRFSHTVRRPTVSFGSGAANAGGAAGGGGTAASNGNSAMHTDITKIRALILNVEDAFNSTTPQAMRGVVFGGGNNNNSSIPSNSSPFAGLGSALGNNSSSSSALKTVTSTSSAPLFFEVCAAIALIPLFSLGARNQNSMTSNTNTGKNSVASSTKELETRKKQRREQEEALSLKSVENLLPPLHMRGLGGSSSSPSLNTSPLFSNSASLMPKANNFEKSPKAPSEASSCYAMYTVETKIDYAKYPMGSALPNGGGKIRVVPQTFGFKIPIIMEGRHHSPQSGHNSHSNNNNSNRNTSTSAAGISSNNSSWEGTKGSVAPQRQQQQGGGWAAAISNKKMATTGGASGGSWASAAGASRGSNDNEPNPTASAAGGAVSALRAKDAIGNSTIETKSKPPLIVATLKLPILASAKSSVFASTREEVSVVTSNKMQSSTASFTTAVVLGTTTITLTSPLIAYLVASAAVAKPSSDGLALGVVDGTMTIFAETSEEFAAIERLRQSISYCLCTATPLPVPVVTLMTAVISSKPCEATTVDLNLFERTSLQ